MFIPNCKLEQWIKVYWFLEANGTGKNFLDTIFIPDGCATILMVFEGIIDFSHGNEYFDSILTNGIYIVPPIYKPYKISMSNNIKVIDIQLKPSVFFKLFNFPVNEFKNKVYTFDDISINFDRTILEKLYEIKNDDLKLYLEINNFLTNLFTRNNFYPDELIYNLSILYKNGNLDDFFHSQNLSIRQIERKVKNYTGLTPQNLSRLGRFYSVLEYMKFRQFNLEYCELALEYNFSDQSHFIREFKSFCNETPSKFLKNIDLYPQYKGLCNKSKIIY
jgi:AraC-like DNA-binding protein